MGRIARRTGGSPPLGGVLRHLPRCTASLSVAVATGPAKNPETVWFADGKSLPAEAALPLAFHPAELRRDKITPLGPAVASGPARQSGRLMLQHANRGVLVRPEKSSGEIRLILEPSRCSQSGRSRRPVPAAPGQISGVARGLPPRRRITCQLAIESERGNQPP